MVEMGSSYEELTTEKVNPETLEIDSCSTEEMLKLINRQDALVAGAVKTEIPNIAKAVDQIYDAITGGGHLIYIGAGTSGRLGVLDAAECFPTYGTDPNLVQAYIAGGDGALRKSSEASEDNAEAGRKTVRDHITAKDVLVGITASGNAAYVLAAINEAKKIGAVTVGISNNRGSEISKICDISITPVVGPEVITGSTRMKAGTAQKLVLNMLSTATMIKLGKVYGNLMVDLKATNKKLKDRSIRIVQQATGVDKKTALQYLHAADLSVKAAILMIQTGLDSEQSQKLLKKYRGHLREAIAEGTAGRNNRSEKVSYPSGGSQTGRARL